MREATEIILNPKGNHERDGRNWIAAQRRCLRELAPAEVTPVESPEEAAQVAKQSALKGYRKIVSVGDGATAHGVVNGVMALAESHRKQIKLGFLSFSHPDQWSRTLALPRDLSRQLEILAAGHTLPFDVGRLDCRDEAGHRVTRHFLNGAWFGVIGGLREEWDRPDAGLVEVLHRTATRLREAVNPTASRVRLESQGAVLFEGHCTQAIVMGGRFYPAFGEIAPQADPADGMLDVAWLQSRNLLELAAKLSGLWLSQVRRGDGHLEWRCVDHLRATSLGAAVSVEADGQPVGRLPANITAARRALMVMVAPVAVKLKRPAFTRVDKIKGGRLVGNIKSAAGL